MRHNFVRLASLLIATIASGAFVSAQTPTGSADSAEAQVQHVLRMQQEAWNRHDLAGFMSGYWNSPDLTFFSGADEHDGWQSTLDRYIARYASPGHEMGTLDFSNLRIEMFGTDAAFVRGAWRVTISHPEGNVDLHGLFTLIFRKFPDGWKIIHDHTSAADSSPAKH